MIGCASVFGVVFLTLHPSAPQIFHRESSRSACPPSPAPRRRLILPSNSQSRTGGEGGAGEDLWRRRGGRACAGVAGRRSQKASNLNQQTREEECGGRERRFNFCGSIGKRRLDNDNGEQVIRWHKIPLLLSLFSESTTEYKYAV